jgi:hypothetical protein
MTHIEQIAQHFRQVHTGGNWTSVNLQSVLSDITLEQATRKIGDLNTIAVLTYHVNYYVDTVLKVLQGGPLTGNDKLSFELPPLTTAAEWRALADKAISDAELFAAAIEQLPAHRLFEDFTDAKYGNYYRNLHGIIEHTHYHLGQMVILKKIIVGGVM